MPSCGSSLLNVTIGSFHAQILISGCRGQKACGWQRYGSAFGQLTRWNLARRSLGYGTLRWKPIPSVSSGLRVLPRIQLRCPCPSLPLRLPLLLLLPCLPLPLSPPSSSPPAVALVPLSSVVSSAHVPPVPLAGVYRGWMEVPRMVGGTFFWNWRFKEAALTLQLSNDIDAACVADSNAWMRIWPSSGTLYPYCVVCKRWMDVDHLSGDTHSKRRAWVDHVPADAAVGPSLFDYAEDERSFLAAQGPWATAPIASAWATAPIVDVNSSHRPTSLPPLDPDSAGSACSSIQMSVVNVD